MDRLIGLRARNLSNDALERIMADRTICVEDECDNVVESDRVEQIEAPVEETGEWVETGEVDNKFGLEVTEWTGEWETVNYGLCVECEERDQRLIKDLEQLSQSRRTE